MTILDRDYIDYVITGDENGKYEIADLTDFTVAQYEKFMRHFDGIEMTIYPGRRVDDQVTMICKTWSNPGRHGELITQAEAEARIAKKSEVNGGDRSVMVYGETRIYNSLGAASMSEWHKCEQFIEFGYWRQRVIVHGERVVVV